MREDGAFGRARGAGGINDARGGVAIERDPGAVRGKYGGERGGLGGELGGAPDGEGGIESGIGDDGRRSGVVQDVRDFAVAVQDVDGHEDDAQFHAGQVEIDHLHAVGEIDAEAVAGIQTAVREQVGEAIAARVELAEGEGSGPEIQAPRYRGG